MHLCALEKKIVKPRSKLLIYFLALIVVFDIITTYYGLTFLEGFKETNPIAFPLIKKFGIVQGLLISVFIELIMIAPAYILLKKLFPRILANRGINIVVFDVFWEIVLLLYIIKHLLAVVNNLVLLSAQF